jgi:hypothetical protein
MIGFEGLNYTCRRLRFYVSNYYKKAGLTLSFDIFLELVYLFGVMAILLSCPSELRTRSYLPRPGVVFQLYYHNFWVPPSEKSPIFLSCSFLPKCSLKQLLEFRERPHTAAISMNFNLEYQLQFLLRPLPESR